jgi:hypothetical protein
MPSPLRRTIRSTVATLAVAGLATVLTACGARSTSSTGASAAPATAGPATTTTRPAPKPTAVNPNAPEVNPAGDIPDNQVFVPYSPPGSRFTVKVPEGWGRTSSNGAVSFTDKLNSIRLESVRSASAPTVASVRQTELPAIEQAAGHYQPGPVTQIRRSAGTAILATYRADAPADPVTGKVVHDDVQRYEFWRGGTAAVLTLSGPVGADNVDPWRIVTDSFRWR